MEPKESSETSAYINTLTPGTYPKETKLQSKHGESLKSRIKVNLFIFKHYFVKGEVEVQILDFLTWSREGRQW